MTIKHVAWGYVTRDIGKGKEVLVAERSKQDDPLRLGELVFPGGEIEENESYTQAAVREVYQETGIRTEYDIDSKKLICQFPERKFQKKNLEGRSSGLIDISLKYKDSKKEYEGALIELYPIDAEQKPIENSKSDARNPRYVGLSWAFENREKFTPACQVLLDIIHECDLDAKPIQTAE